MVKYLKSPKLPIRSFIIALIVLVSSCSPESKSSINIVNYENNDLSQVLKQNGIPFKRFDTPGEAVRKAKEGSGLMILADGYPEKTTLLDSFIIEEATRKRLRLYVEFPSWLPGMKTGQPKETALERVVVVTDRIQGLDPLQILSIHGCFYTLFDADDHLLSLSKVAGFDRSVYGTGEDSHAILFNHHSGNILVSTTKLSQFVTARYAPKESMQALWAYILTWVSGGSEQFKELGWESTVRPTFRPDDELPVDAERSAVQRGIDWHTNAKMILSKGGWDEYRELWKLDDYNINTTVPSVNNAAPLPVSDAGDGTYGVLEGIASEVRLDGSQPARWWLRSDSNGESSLAFSLRSAMDGDQRSRLIAGNLLDWLYFNSGLFQNDPAKDNYGLLFWAPGNAQALYQDNDIKAILGCMGTAAILETDKWDEVLVKNILGNFRTTGINGFRGRRIENPDLLKKGWQSYMKRDFTLYQPHYESWTWSSYLTFPGLHEAYAATGDIQFKRMADRLTDFLIRIQVKSDKHTSLDGGWMRAFDYGRWDYLGSNADSGWGAWSIEVGWTQAWVPTVLAMRELNKNLWDITEKSNVAGRFEDIRKQMIPDDVIMNLK